MEDKLQSPILKSAMTAVFVIVSYLISNCFLVTEYFLSFLESKWHLTVSVAIYTAIQNIFFLFLLSKRTEINVDIYDKKDESHSISIEEKPRKIIAKIKLSGHLDDIQETVTITFPEWVDSMIEADPGIKQISISPDVYCIKLSDKEISFAFDIAIKDIYGGTSRKNDIFAEISGKSLRYNKISKKLLVQYKK